MVDETRTMKKRALRFGSRTKAGDRRKIYMEHPQIAVVAQKARHQLGCPENLRLGRISTQMLLATRPVQSTKAARKIEYIRFAHLQV
jgi:hypothetical protein